MILGGEGTPALSKIVAKTPEREEGYTKLNPKVIQLDVNTNTEKVMEK